MSEHTKTAKDLLSEVKADISTRISSYRVAGFALINEAEEFGVVDDYGKGLEDIVEKYGNMVYKEKYTGIPVGKLNLVFPDHALLNAARKTLREQKVISEEKVGQTTLVKPYTEPKAD